MGGFGSTRWYSKRTTVEGSLPFNPAKLRSLGVIRSYDFKPGSKRRTLISWTNGASAVLEIDMTTKPPRMVLSYTIKGGRHIENRIQLSSAPQHLGGVRWWLHCPHCECRVATLHLPPGAIYYRCRQCYNLTYVKCQESHRWDTLQTLDLFDKHEKLLDKLSCCHPGSKHFRRVLVRLKKLEGKMGTAIVFRSMDEMPDNV